ncbi:stAR-related lipid transfer protein 6-like isoform X2 [Clavelina lepadiformis]|uniref:stAR-related lipid transfer protein 6-like isoform X2 n=1 Tax=Clavelina lepadiformis TaxID=159417 RepID=UPI0040417E06
MFFLSLRHILMDICRYRYTCEIDAPCHVVYEVLKPPKTSAERLAWDKSIAGYERVHTYNENLFIAVIVTPTVFTGLISQREFLDLFTFRTIDTDSSQTHWVFATSVKDERRPETRNYVRAFTHPSGYSATAISSGRTKVEFFINIETGGMLPRSLVEMAMPSQQIKYIESLKKEVKRRCK